MQLSTEYFNFNALPVPMLRQVNSVFWISFLRLFLASDFEWKIVPRGVPKGRSGEHFSLILHIFCVFFEVCVDIHFLSIFGVPRMWKIDDFHWSVVQNHMWAHLEISLRN